MYILTQVYESYVFLSWVSFVYIVIKWSNKKDLIYVS